ncbi:MAG: SAM-dependent methyltransferase [Gammaproteobacteria bacterium]|nr:SAM-dependent methyltransferase [Gammaproteobacteria bacterium]
MRHSDAVAALIRAEIEAARGWISFERFMELALYAPGLGYYSAGAVKLGAGGDFVTAPEMSALFGRCLARQCAQVLRITGGSVLEIGAGTGALAAAILPGIAELGVLPERYAILEVSGDLADRQRERLMRLPPALKERLTWLQRLPERPLTGMILANEVADALPCRRVRASDKGLMELGVTAAVAGAAAAAQPRLRERHSRGPPDPGEPMGLRELAVPADAGLAAAWREICAALPGPLPQGYTSEICLRAPAWIASLGECLGRGALLICDYGLPRRHYYHPQRVDGTLRCHFKQHAHDDPFINVGVQDITAWVDFTGIAAAGATVGLEVAGFATQTAFLLSLGIETLVADASDDLERARLAGEARRLLMPEEMGETFKAMALSRDFDDPLGGFAVQDLRHSL